LCSSKCPASVKSLAEKLDVCAQHPSITTFVSCIATESRKLSRKLALSEHEILIWVREGDLRGP